MGIHTKLCMIIVLPVSLGQISIVTSPINQAVLATSNVKFECRVQQSSGLTNYLSWEEYITKADGRRISNDLNKVYEALGGDPVRGQRYSISNPAQGQYDLTISGTVFEEDAGKYQCFSANDVNIRKSAQLILIDGDPVCSRNTSNPNEALPGQIIRMVCEVPFRGRWAPIISWSVNGQLINDIKDESSGGVVRYSVSVEITPDQNGHVYSSRMYFNPPADTAENEATNAPSYVKNVQFDALTVFYPPYDITITSDGEGCFTPRVRLSCNTLANPQAQYEWTDLNTTEVISTEKVIVVSESMLGSQTYQCRAHNDHGSVTENIEFTVCTTTTTTTTTTKSTTVGTTTIETTSGIPTPGAPCLQGDSCQCPSCSCSGLSAGLGVMTALFIASLIGYIVQAILSRRRYQSNKQPNPEYPVAEFGKGNHTNNVTLPGGHVTYENIVNTPTRSCDVDDLHVGEPVTYERVGPRDPVVTPEYNVLDNINQSATYETTGPLEPVTPSVYADLH